MTPQSLYERVKKIPGFDPQELAWNFERELAIGEPMNQRELEDWVSSHIPREEQWFRIAETLLREDQPDLFAVMFDGTDKIQHQVWHVLDPALRPAQPDEDYRRLRDLVVTLLPPPRRLHRTPDRTGRSAGAGVPRLGPRVYRIGRSAADQLVPGPTRLSCLGAGGRFRCRPQAGGGQLRASRLEEDQGLLPDAVEQRHLHPCCEDTGRPGRAAGGICGVPRPADRRSLRAEKPG